MTTIVAASTMDEIFAAYPITPSTTDLAAWTELDLPTNAAALQTAGFDIGLFGYDLTDFFAACVTATACEDTFYNADYFDGWSIGSNITIETTFVDEELVVVLENYHASFGFGAGTAGALTDFYSMPVPAGFAITAAVGDSTDFNSFLDYTRGYGFESGWFGSPSYYGTTDTDYINFVSF